MNNVRIIRYLAWFLTLFSISGAASAERASDDVIVACRAALSSEKDAIVINASATSPLPQEYRQVAGAGLQDAAIGGWTTHRNPDGTSTIVIHAFDSETKEGHFVVMAKGNSLAFKQDVYAFEFAFSRRNKSGVTGLFFCSRTGPSNEWIWTGSDWKVAR